MYNFIHNGDKVRVAIIGCGLAGYTHLVECSFHSDICVLALCSQNIKKAKNFSERFGVPSYFDNVKECLKSIGEAIDAIIISIPPSAVKGVLSYCNKDNYFIIVDKPGTFIDEKSTKTRTRFYYSRRSYSDFYMIQNSIMASLKSCKRIGYRVSGPYLARYTEGRTYLSGNNEYGIILDTLSHFFDMITELIDFNSLSVINAKLKGEPETSAEIVLHSDIASIDIKLIDCGGDVSKNDIWEVYLNGMNWKVNDKTVKLNTNGISSKENRHYIFSYADQLVSLVRGEGDNFFVDCDSNGKTLNLINKIYNFANRKTL